MGFYDEVKINKNVLMTKEEYQEILEISKICREWDSPREEFAFSIYKAMVYVVIEDYDFETIEDEEHYKTRLTIEKIERDE